MSDLPVIDHIPSIAEVDQIAHVGNPVIRNLQITQCYHELALAMTARTGICANWCTFATWASKLAGQTIRKEDLARTLEALWTSAPSLPDIAPSAQAFGSKLKPLEIHKSLTNVLNPLAALDRASDAVGRGNKKVFEEIGREFARFYATCLNDLSYDDQKIAQFCAALRPGDPPDGQQFLRQAFTRYYRALFENDPKRRAELMLLANIEIGYHEQTRLQPEIAEAMDAAMIDRGQFRQQVIRALFPKRGWFAQSQLLLMRVLGRPNPLDEVIDALLAEARRQTHLVITKHLMTIELSNEIVLRLGEDVLGQFPPSLQQIALAELLGLLERIDPTRDSTHETRVVDWAQLPDRLHFIVDMFRCYHETANLFEPPFSEAQVVALKSNRLPGGRL